MKENNDVEKRGLSPLKAAILALYLIAAVIIAVVYFNSHDLKYRRQGTRVAVTIDRSDWHEVVMGKKASKTKAYGHYELDGKTYENVEVISSERILIGTVFAYVMPDDPMKAYMPLREGMMAFVYIRYVIVTGIVSVIVSAVVLKPKKRGASKHGSESENN